MPAPGRVAPGAACRSQERGGGVTSTTEKLPTELPRRLWTADAFERAGELGLFGADERLELIAGEILVKMSPQGSRHGRAKHRARRRTGQDDSGFRSAP